MHRATGKHVTDKMSATCQPKSFAQDTAGKLGVSPRTIERTIQTMKGLTQETRDVFHHFPNYELSQNNAAKLSRLDPAKQKTAAILLATDHIRSVDEYDPEQVKGKPKRNKVVLESIAHLKDPTRIASHNSGSFLFDYRAMIHGVQRKIDSFCDPCNEESIPALSQSEMEELQSLTDSCCEMMQDFLKKIREGEWQQHA